MDHSATPRLIIRYNYRLSLLRLWRREMRDAVHLPAVLEVMLTAVARYKARQLVLNLQKLPPFSLKMQEWLQTSWLPRLRVSGIRRLAVLLPADVYNMMVVEGLLWTSTRYALPYEVQYFTETAAALDWLCDAEVPSSERDWLRCGRAPRLLRARRKRPLLRHKNSVAS
ncbi:hypothetical protein [Hymenobacter perfusus]|uniref:STAS/SEC14 domain-containing protein n=1 Tax=Hymenobacter perfusus TaxID=1236770 RepID=A0A428KIL7_9BACT|nr:hypothetical protein [Hymenobacter perfusus]RSK46307.1 hypothetical protein EI293_03825 [Hymenobacter perfusus]